MTTRVTVGYIALREEWICKCGAGVCIPRGSLPDPSVHRLYDGRVCESYEYAGPCDCEVEEVLEVVDEIEPDVPPWKEGDLLMGFPIHFVKELSEP